MKLIVGLGNPGEKYQNNRHNIGFQFLDYLIENFKIQSANRRIKFKVDKYTNSQIAKLMICHSEHIHSVQCKLREKSDQSSTQPSDSSPRRMPGFRMTEEVLLCKPITYMNKSGVAVKQCVTRFALHVTRDLIVVHDDLDIPLGKFKIQTGTGPQLHNGIDSINANLKTHDYLRIRIGVDNRLPENRINGETYVLQDFTEEEMIIISQQVFPAIYSQLQTNK